MSTQRMALSFLTESKASHVGITSMRRVAITLLVMLLASVSAWAQNYQLSLNDNYEGGASTIVPVPWGSSKRSAQQVNILTFRSGLL